MWVYVLNNVKKIENDIREIKLNTAYGEIFTPDLFSPLSPSLSTDEFKTGRIMMSQTISLKTHLYMSGQVQNRAKLFARVEGQKIHRTKNILFTVCIHSDLNLFIFNHKVLWIAKKNELHYMYMF